MGFPYETASVICILRLWNHWVFFSGCSVATLGELLSLWHIFSSSLYPWPWSGMWHGVGLYVAHSHQLFPRGCCTRSFFNSLKGFQTFPSQGCVLCGLLSRQYSQPSSWKQTLVGSVTASLVGECFEWEMTIIQVMANPYFLPQNEQISFNFHLINIIRLFWSDVSEVPPPSIVYLLQIATMAVLALRSSIMKQQFLSDANFQHNYSSLLNNQQVPTPSIIHIQCQVPPFWCTCW